MATIIWIGDSTAGDWSVAVNWSTASVPTDGDDVWLDGAYSFVSHDFFAFPQTGNILSTNSPMNKGSLALIYQSIRP